MRPTTPALAIRGLLSVLLLTTPLAVLAISLFAGSARSAALAPAAKTGRQHALIAAPRNGARITSARFRVRVRVAARPFRATLDGRNVAGWFHGGRVRTATFTRGRGIKLGPHTMLVTVGKGRRLRAEHLTFTLWRVDRQPLRVVRKQPKVVNGGRSVLHVHVFSDRPIAGQFVRVNGRLAGGSDKAPGNARKRLARGYGFGFQLGADHGLRFGPNRIGIEVDHPGYVLQSTMRVMRISRRIPLVGAGRDRRGAVGHALVLDGTVRAGYRGRRMRSHWVVVSRPAHARFRLIGVHRLRPRLITRTPGQYRLRLEATSLPLPRRAAATMRPGAQAGLPIPPINFGPTSASDDMTVSVAATDDPMGLPIQTVTTGEAIQIGQPGNAGSTTYARRGGWVQMLVLYPTSATPASGPWDHDSGISESRHGVLAFNPGQGADLVKAVNAAGLGNYDVVLSGQGQAVKLSSSDASDLGKAIQALGGTVSAAGPTPNGAANLADGQWSLVGYPGLPQGQAWQNEFETEAGISGFLGGSAGAPGTLNGYLQQVTANGYQYVSPEAVSIDTKWTPSLSTPPSATQNTIAIGQTHYTSSSLSDPSVGGCPCTLGIQLLVLDPGDLHAIRAGTFGILASNGSSDKTGILALDAVLHQYVSDHTAGAQPLIVMQDFGHSSAASSPPAGSPDWVQDALPNTYGNGSWKGNNYPSKLTSLVSLWNRQNANGTVAGNIGALAGQPAHDVVANYRRKVYSITQSKVMPRTWGGLTVVATANAYQISDAFVQGQGDNPPTGPNAGSPLLDNGTVTGVLQRNQQGQWSLDDSTQGSGYPGLVNGVPTDNAANAYDPGALQQLVDAPSSPWPCSKAQPAPCPGTSAQVAAAMAYVSGQLPLGGIDDVRDDYDVDDLQYSWTDLRLDLGQIDCSGHSGFTADTCTKLIAELTSEFQEVNVVNGGFSTLRSLIAGTASQVPLNLTKAGVLVTNAVEKARHDLLKQEAEINVTSTLQEALRLGSEIAEVAILTGQSVEAPEYIPAALGMASSLIGLGSEADPFFNPPVKQESVPDNAGAIRARVQDLGADIAEQLANVNETLKHFQDIVRTDPVKLREAASNFALKWALSTANEKRIAQALTVSADQTLYTTVLPLAYDEWMIGPKTSDINTGGVQDLPDRGYNCRKLNSDGKEEDSLVHPLGNEPASMSAMSSVAWSGGNLGPQSPFTVRALKASDNPIQIEGAQFDLERGENFVQSNGESPDASLSDNLFEPPSDLVNAFTPTSVGMDKDVLFGQPSWRIRMLECGQINRS